jgi:putative ABC transport system permease protein
MALGAGRTNVRTMIVRQAMIPVLFGVVVGIAGAMTLTRALASLLYGMNAVDPLTYLGVVVILVLVAACGSYLPARRASQVDPILALRYE